MGPSMRINAQIKLKAHKQLAQGGGTGINTCKTYEFNLGLLLACIIHALCAQPANSIRQCLHGRRDGHA